MSQVVTWALGLFLVASCASRTVKLRDPVAGHITPRASTSSCKLPADCQLAGQCYAPPECIDGQCSSVAKACPAGTVCTTGDCKASPLIVVLSGPSQPLPYGPLMFVDGTLQLDVELKNVSQRVLSVSTSLLTLSVRSLDQDGKVAKRRLGRAMLERSPALTVKESVKELQPGASAFVHVDTVNFVDTHETASEFSPARGHHRLSLVYQYPVAGGPPSLFRGIAHSNTIEFDVE